MLSNDGDRSQRDFPRAPDAGSGSEEDTSQLTSSHGQLLRSLNSYARHSGPSPKKRKPSSDPIEPAVGLADLAYTNEETPDDDSLTDDLNSMTDLDVPNGKAEDVAKSNLIAVKDEEEGTMGRDDLTDPFESHFASPDANALSEAVKAIKDHRWISQSSNTPQGFKQQYTVPISDTNARPETSRIQAFKSLKLKRKLVVSGQKVWSSFGLMERELSSVVFTYRDLLYGSRTIDNAPRLRDLVVLHGLNHVFKTRDRVIKNKAKMTNNGDRDISEIRDQGFTRPKVLFVLPTRQACVRYVESLVKLCRPEQQENISRFMESFSQDDGYLWEEKPRDFQELFGGNDDDMFRIGLKFTRKTVKFFSAFYNSDVILASPLGLRTAIETGTSKDGKKGDDADFLSSIEIVVMDHANALLMQNWQHVEYIFSKMNLLPKESHGCDFSRIRHWYLDGEAKYLRQTIVLTDFVTPEINSVYTKTMLNVAGKFRYVPIYEGTMIDVSASLGIPMTFLRLNASTPALDVEVRFSNFTSTILPSLLTSKQENGVLIFMSSYLDFVRVRNHFSASTATTSLSFGAISEYTSVRDVARTRSHFRTGRQSVLLYSERAHHFRRYKLKGVKRVVFYSLPENPVYWSEVVKSLMPDTDGTDKGRHVVRALFSMWDVLKLERIVGTSRVGKMVNDKAGNSFEFI